MSAGIGNFVVSYMLFPIIVLIMGMVSVVIAKKNKLLSDKKAVVFVLLSSLFYSLFGLCGFWGVSFMPYVFVILQFLFLLIGYVNKTLLLRFIPQMKTKKQSLIILTIVLQYILAWAVFSIIFNVVSELQYGFWAGTCLLPLLFYPFFESAYQSYLAIPAEIYKIRVYKADDVYEPPCSELDVSQVMVFVINVPRYVGDDYGVNINSKAVRTFVLGDWFGMIIVDNNKLHINNQVELFDQDGSYGWIFYTEKSFLKSRRYLDPELTFEANGLISNGMVVARRVRNVEL